MAIQAGLKESKQRLRKEIRQRLRSLNHDDISIQSKVIANKILQMPEYKDAARLSVYMSMPDGEVSTRDIVIDALSEKKKVFVPHIHGRKASSKIIMLALSSLEDFESLRADAWGIPSLGAESVASRENALGGLGTVERGGIVDAGDFGLDMIVMPGMAFDTSKRRLGHGRGYYDRYLQEYHENLNRTGARSPMPHLVGLALREQIVPSGHSIPTGDLDWTLDKIVSSNKDSIVE
ncbi:MAG: hypothetical protein Q9160_005703 [Pyrenula sp. 1 TL-2023]